MPVCIARCGNFFGGGDLNFKMKIIFLGTNDWYDTKTVNTICILIETKTEYLVLDAGCGIYKLDRYIKAKKPIYLFLSHFHLGRIFGLHILNKFDFPQGIDVYGPRGLKECFKTVINSPYTIPARRLKTKIRLNDLNENARLPVNAEFKKLKHSTICYSYRFKAENKVFSYCTDTEICRNLFLLAKNSDLLISECSFKFILDAERP